VKLQLKIQLTLVASGRVQSKEAKKYKGRWFSPDKNEAKWFSGTAEDKSQKGSRILKTVNVSKKIIR
jgi:hypothetical protein